MSIFDYTAYDQYIDWDLSDYNLCLKPFLTQFFVDNKFDSILDIGFGSGFLPIVLNNLQYQNQYLGIDTSEQAIQHIQKENLPSNFAFRAKFENKNNDQFDLAFCSLSLIEMSDDTILTYFTLQPAQQVLIIQPSALAFTYPSKVIKKFPSNITQFFGAKPHWQLLLNINPKNPTNTYQHQIKNPDQNQQNLISQIHSRSAGNLLNLFNKANYQMQNYWELSVDYQTTSKTSGKSTQYLQRKIPPLPKFEIFLLASR